MYDLPNKLLNENNSFFAKLRFKVIFFCKNAKKAIFVTVKM